MEGSKDVVKITRNRYQQGSIRKVPRAKGFAWEYRYYVTLDGKRKLKMQTFSGKLYTTEADVRRAVGAMVPGLNDGTLYSPSVTVTFGDDSRCFEGSDAAQHDRPDIQVRKGDERGEASR